jgi:hypothetical protein
MVLLLSKVQFVHLGGNDNSNNGGILFKSVDFNFNRLVLLVIMFLRVLGESFLLRFHPVLVESSQGILI